MSENASQAETGNAHLLEEIQREYGKLTLHAIQELGSFKKPPKPIEDLLAAVCLILGEKSTTWENAQKVMRQHFLQKLYGVDPAAIPKKTITKLKSTISEPWFQEENLKKINISAANLSCWVRAVVLSAELAGEQQAPKTEQTEVPQKKHPEHEEEKKEDHKVEQEPETSNADKLEEIQREYGKLTLHAIQELGSFKKPPKPIEDLLAAVCLILGEKTTTWENAQKVMRQHFLQKLYGVDPAAIPKKTITKLKSTISEPWFQEENLKKINISAANLSCWVRAVVLSAELAGEQQAPKTEQTEAPQEKEKKEEKEAPVEEKP